ncbi:MAG: 23S rRNA (adenine(2030)-N(6))-methyltransferase RlmJ [Thiotrichales bacterium]
MLSYRHAYHAGNHADVLKHAVYTLILNYFRLKPTPFCVIDGHAGAGQYNLNDTPARMHAEYRDGVARILGVSAPKLLQPYLQALEAHQSYSGELHSYPGSPALARSFLRPQDELILLELHPSDFAQLKQRYCRDRQIHLHRRDAYEGLPALVPPRLRRGLLLLDPPYELKEDYHRIPELVTTLQNKWPTACVVVWYPLLPGNPGAHLITRLKRSALPDLLQIELWTQSPESARGLYGSGLIIHQPPWQLVAQLNELLPWLTTRLTQGSGAGWTVRALTAAR